MSGPSHPVDVLADEDDESEAKSHMESESDDPPEETGEEQLHREQSSREWQAHRAELLERKINDHPYNDMVTQVLHLAGSKDNGISVDDLVQQVMPWRMTPSEIVNKILEDLEYDKKVFCERGRVHMWDARARREHNNPHFH
jgi:hypothetical protein